jgi:hypothetical protein
MPHLIRLMVGLLAESAIHHGIDECCDHAHQDMEDASRVAAVAVCRPTIVAGRMTIAPEEQRRNLAGSTSSWATPPRPHAGS